MPPSTFTPIETARLRIRSFDESDLATLHAYRNDAEIARYQGFRAVDSEELLRFILHMNRASPETVGDWLQWAVEEKATGLHFGDVGAHRQADEPLEAEITYTFAREAHGRGYATEAVAALLNHLFGVLGLHRVTALIYADNLRSIALVERLGFRKEGHFRRSARRDGAWVDDLLYALLEDEWSHGKNFGREA